MTPRCSTCHQPIPDARFGVPLTPLKAAVVDCIKAAGDIGVSSEELLMTLWRDRGPVETNTIKSHVNQINDALAGTDWRIHSDRRRWFLTRRQS
jgi:DNA-binding response OmpR family regulator